MQSLEEIIRLLRNAAEFEDLPGDLEVLLYNAADNLERFAILQSAYNSGEQKFLLLSGNNSIKTSFLHVNLLDFKIVNGWHDKEKIQESFVVIEKQNLNSLRDYLSSRLNAVFPEPVIDNSIEENFEVIIGDLSDKPPALGENYKVLRPYFLKFVDAAYQQGHTKREWFARSLYIVSEMNLAIDEWHNIFVKKLPKEFRAKGLLEKTLIARPFYENAMWKITDSDVLIKLLLRDKRILLNNFFYDYPSWIHSATLDLS